MEYQLTGPSLDYSIPMIKVATESYKAFKMGYRIIVNQGGTRSGKTFTIAQLLIALALKEKCTISITSVAFPHLRRGAMRDWRTIMENSGLYDQNHHVRTEQVYNYPNGSYIEFFSSDNNLKVRGPGRDILFFNEANLTDFDTFTQLMLRTRKAIFIDFNPADEFHWIYDNILTRADCYFIKSTYLDNPFLPNEQVKEIENLKNVDSNFWRIYGEGERGHSEGVIYTHWQPFSSSMVAQSVFGLDFGYNNPTALVRVTDHDSDLYWKEEIYQSHLTNSDLIPMLKQIVKPHETIYCDSAEPNRIEELRRAGIKAIPANKDVKSGIDFIKSRKLFIHSGSANLLKEIKSYKYMDQGKRVGNEPEIPLKLNDHCFAGDTLIHTSKGLKEIRNVEAFDLVYTSKGLKPVLQTWCNGYKITQKYTMQFDTISLTLECTPDHKVYTNKGWKQISKLKSGMTVSLISSLTAENLYFSPGSDISEVTKERCIQLYGKYETINPQSVTTYTIETETHGIIRSTTLRSKKEAITYHSILKLGTQTIIPGPGSFNQKVSKLLKIGIKALKDWLGIVNTQKEQVLAVKDLDLDSAQFADENTKQKQSHTYFVIKTARLKHFEEGEENYQPVYDLTVDDTHEYFANGVLVHNCMDAARYASISFKKSKTPLNMTFHR